MPEGTQRLTKERARYVLEQAREDIAMLLSRQFETQEEIYRLLSINTELYEGILHEAAPEMSVRAHSERVS